MRKGEEQTKFKEERVGKKECSMKGQMESKIQEEYEGKRLRKEMISFLQPHVNFI